MKLNFIEGRRSSEKFKYYKSKLFEFKAKSFGMDCYILKYPNKGSMPRHKDGVNNGEHYRLNISLSGESEFYSHSIGTIPPRKGGKINLFNPGKQEHFIKIIKPTVYKISLGFVKFKSKNEAIK